MRTQSYNKSELEDHIAIGVVLRNSNDEILCFKHVKWDFWTFPVGKAEDGETAEEATVREMREELGINTTKLEKIYDIPHDYIREKRLVKVRLVLYEVTSYTGKVKNLEHDKHLEFGYMKLEDLAKKTHLSDMLMLYLDYKKIAYKDSLNWLTVDQIDHDKRLDVFLPQKFEVMNRSMVKKLIKLGYVQVNGKQEKAKYRVSKNDVISVDFDAEYLSETPEISLPIIYEDSDCIVIDKPAGVLTHSKGVFNSEATVASFIADKINFPSDGNRRGIVHRLDRGTSGVIICAKNSNALSWLQKQFSTRRVKKTYVAVTSRTPKHDQAVIDMPIERNPKRPQTFRVGTNGKQAVTEYKLLNSNDDRALVELRPKTGRTHQLRVHLSHIGCPIVGDSLYGGESADRLYLHAKELEITLPNRKRTVFKSALPKGFNG
ncbi:RluA family pseudouridine synthase [Candidatus Saccharibacteria bacterium]|nr:RluA family pseudouridine synthase [Candidatus Saccharibacteria bacterium]